MISDLNRLKETFQNMRSDNFNTEKPLNWGYYFINNNKSGLEKLSSLLSKDYHLVSLRKINTKEWRLNVSRIEIMNAEDLHKRNLEFNDLAINNDILLYDGWDVEKI